MQSLPRQSLLAQPSDSAGDLSRSPGEARSDLVAGGLVLIDPPIPHSGSGPTSNQLITRLDQKIYFVCCETCFCWTCAAGAPSGRTSALKCEDAQAPSTAQKASESLKYERLV